MPSAAEAVKRRGRSANAALKAFAEVRQGSPGGRRAPRRAGPANATVTNPSQLRPDAAGFKRDALLGTLAKESLERVRGVLSAP